MILGKKEVDKKNFFQRIEKDLLVFTFVGGIIIIIILFVFLFMIEKSSSVKILQCGDDTPYGSCSKNKPYFCEDRKLVSKATVCGCPNTLTFEDGECLSKFMTNPKNISLGYVLRGEENWINITVFEGMVDYVSSLPRFITYFPGQIPSRKDFKLRNINEPEQREFLLPLVVEIQNLAPEDKVEQFRIAVSLVQEITFGNSNENFSFAGLEIDYARRPYEVLYDQQGVCGEKSELLAFILREIGYDVAFFYNQEENHESLGVKCPLSESYRGSGYCFIETTASSIITDNQINYVGGIKLKSTPEVIPISESRGIVLSEDLYEYKDALDWMNIRWSIEQNGRVPTTEYFKWKNLQKKYNVGIEFNP